MSCPVQRVQVFRYGDGRIAYARLPPIGLVERLYEALRAAVRRPGAWEDAPLVLTSLLAYTGARVGEALAATTEDLLWHTSGPTAVRLRTAKTRGIAVRVVPVPVEVAGLLDRYVVHHGVSHRLFPIPRQTAHRWATATTRRLVGCRLSPHMLRHAYAVRALTEWGYTPGELRELLGHSSLKLTELYVRYVGYRPPNKEPTL